MEYKGIDISKYQGDIDFNKVSKNIDFAIIRIGYGMYESQKDPKFEANYEGFRNANIPVGVYLYSYALNENEAEREADVVIKWLNNRNLNLPVYFDIEDKSQINLGKTKLTNMCERFCKKIEKAGYWAGIYANKYFFTTYLDYKKLEEKYTIWVAQWNDQNTYSGKYDMWQYTSTGKVPGVNGNVDMNILYRNIFTNMGGNTPSTPIDLPDISGYNGTSIVDALKSAGFDSSFDARTILYKKLGFEDPYYGTAVQNTNMLNKLRGQESYYSSNYRGLSFVDGLKSIGVDSSFENRKRIAFRNGITNYTGSAIQNIRLLNLLKQGKLKK